MSSAPPGRASSLAGLLEGGGAGLILIGAFVPWVVTVALIATVPVRGLETHLGRLLPLIPLTAFGLIAWRWYARRAQWVHLLIVALGASAIALTIGYAVGVKRNLAQAQQSLARSGQALPGSVDVRFDVGMYLTALGGAAMIVGGLLGARQERGPNGKQTKGTAT